MTTQPLPTEIAIVAQARGLAIMLDALDSISAPALTKTLAHLANLIGDLGERVVALEAGTVHEEAH